MRRSYSALSLALVVTGSLMTAWSAANASCTPPADSGAVQPSHARVAEPAAQPTDEYDRNSEQGLAGDGSSSGETLPATPSADQPAEVSQAESADANGPYRYEFPETRVQTDQNDASAVEGEVQNMEEYFSRYGFDYAGSDIQLNHTAEESAAHADPLMGTTESDTSASADDGLQPTGTSGDEGSSAPYRGEAEQYNYHQYDYHQYDYGWEGTLPVDHGQSGESAESDAGHDESTHETPSAQSETAEAAAPAETAATTDASDENSMDDTGNDDGSTSDEADDNSEADGNDDADDDGDRGEEAQSGDTADAIPSTEGSVESQSGAEGSTLPTEANASGDQSTYDYGRWDYRYSRYGYIYGGQLPYSGHSPAPEGYSEAYPDAQYAYPADTGDDATVSDSAEDSSCYGDSYDYPDEASQYSDEASLEDQSAQNDSEQSAEDSNETQESAYDFRDEYGCPEEAYLKSQNAGEQPSAESYGDADRRWEDSYEPGDQSRWEGEPGEDLNYGRHAQPESYQDSGLEAEYGSKYVPEEQPGASAEEVPSDAENRTDDASAESAPSGLELFAWLPGELLTASDQDILRTLARLCEESPDVRRAALNDYLEGIGSEALQFATRFEDATRIEVLGLADDLPGAAAFLGCFRLVEQGELGMDEAADLLRRTLARLSKEWIDGVGEITSDAFEHEAVEAYALQASEPAANDEVAAEHPILGVVASVASRSVAGLGGVVGTVSRRLANLDWGTLVAAMSGSREASHTGAIPRWFQR
jgi:hypothetical protein